MIVDDATHVEILETVREYEAACAMLSFTTGPKRFGGFTILTTGSILAQRMWATIQSGVQNRTVESFTASVQEFLQEMLKPLNYSKQLDYLRTLKKPQTMENNGFV